MSCLLSIRPLLDGNLLKGLKLCRALAADRKHIHVCIIGSGPGGFYTAQQLLKNPKVTVDIYEKLPVPFGLVRFGVAPDHPEVKNVISTFTATASNPNCNFIGNVLIGKDITVEELKKAYNCIILSYGAEEDRRLEVCGEELANVLSARNFVGWYNGLPDDSTLKVDLDVETAVIVGQGNVALDVARILLSPLDKLKETDITQQAMEALSRSRVRRVVLVGRRGPLQAAFTIKELREMVKLPNTRSVIHKEDFQDVQAHLQTLARPRKRLTELMMSTLEAPKNLSFSKEWELKFLRSPLEILADVDTSRKVRGIVLGINKLEGDIEKASAVLTKEVETIECGMVLRSIGFKSNRLDDNIPFDDKKGVLPNTTGKVADQKGVYCSGWVKTGPVGVIVSTMNSSFETGQTVLKDIKEGVVPTDVRPGREAILKLLNERGCQTTSFEDWKKIDSCEQEKGKMLGKPREKFLSTSKMLEVL